MKTFSKRDRDPLIIGGMKEKIEGIAGITFDAKISASLAYVIEKAIKIEVFESIQAKLASTKNLLAMHLNVLSN